MRKPWKIILIALVAIGIATLAWVVIRPREPEPSYQGKSLSFWLDQNFRDVISSDVPDSDLREAEKAIQQIGTNAIPILLRKLREKDSRLRPMLIGLLTSQRIVRINYMTAADHNWEAVYAFEIIGHDASNAVPALGKIIEDNVSTSSQHAAAEALRHISPTEKQALPSWPQR